MNNDSTMLFQCEQLKIEFQYPPEASQTERDTLRTILVNQWYETIKKYWDGWKRHGKSDLMNKSADELLKEALFENIDQSVYLRALKLKMDEVKNDGK